MICNDCGLVHPTRSQYVDRHRIACEILRQAKVSENDKLDVLYVRYLLEKAVDRTFKYTSVPKKIILKETPSPFVNFMVFIISLLGFISFFIVTCIFIFLCISY